MRVRCAAETLSAEQIARYGSSFKRNQTFGVTAGVEYTVLGMLFTFDAPARGTGAYLVVPLEHDRVSTAPIVLFEVVDAAVPADWRVARSSDEVRMLPDEMQSPYFFDDLSEQEPSALQALRRVLSRSRGP